jgi:LuxR family maltose regulon positive regulatory protein
MTAVTSLLTTKLYISPPRSNEDAQVLTLLRDVRHTAPAFVDRLLNYARGAELAQETAPQPLIEPLSERELDVPRLIAVGLANREIADRLFITVGSSGVPAVV